MITPGVHEDPIQLWAFISWLDFTTGSQRITPSATYQASNDVIRAPAAAAARRLQP